MSIERQIGILGFGNMGGAILRGLLEKGCVTAEQVSVYDVDPTKAAEATASGVRASASPEALAEWSEVLLLCTKPQDIDTALDAIAPGLSPDTFLISIEAGISSAYIRGRLGQGYRVARVMPNTPALVSTGAAGMALSENCTEDDAQIVETIFGAIGIVERMDEELIDVVTALSGSGPAYFFHLVECLVDAAVELGLPEEQAIRLAKQTCLGAGRLLDNSDETAAVLRERVTSKGGTTAAALEAFRKAGFAETVAAGGRAATERSKELGS